MTYSDISAPNFDILMILGEVGFPNLRISIHDMQNWLDCAFFMAYIYWSLEGDDISLSHCF